MIDAREAILIAHRNNLARYCRLLATQLTDVERDFIHRRLAEERLAVERLERERVSRVTDTLDEAPAFHDIGGGASGPDATYFLPPRACRRHRGISRRRRRTAGRLGSQALFSSDTYKDVRDKSRRSLPVKTI